MSTKRIMLTRGHINIQKYLEIRDGYFIPESDFTNTIYFNKAYRFRTKYKMERIPPYRRIIS
jgi:hypothetical protein